MMLVLNAIVRPASDQRAERDKELHQDCRRCVLDSEPQVPRAERYGGGSEECSKALDVLQ